MRIIEVILRAAARIPRRRWGDVSASALLVAHFQPSGTWSALARLFAATTMLLLLPVVAELLNRVKDRLK
jgi:hypothetical protein